MSTADSVIEIEQLSKTYRSGFMRRRRVEALNSVSFNVQRGEIFGLLGPNGAGKTTLIKILLGIVRKTGGQASMLGAPAGHRATRARIGYLPESHQIPRHLTGHSALEYYGGLNGLSPREARRRGNALLEQVGLAEWGKASVKSYSKGMKQRLGLAQAMLHSPELIVLDEPTDGVDPVGRAEIRELLSKLKSAGTTIFINSHLLQEIELVCDRVAILAHGRLKLAGSVEELTSGQATAGEYQLQIQGSEETARAAVAPAKIRNWTPLAEDGHQFDVFLESQADVDQLLDRLRAAEISIRELTRPKSTLEDTFLEIVSK